MTTYRGKKPLVPIHNVPMWQWVGETLHRQCARTIINLRDDALDPDIGALGATIVYDEDSEAASDHPADKATRTNRSEGPLAGILVALEWARKQGYRCLAIVPCDVPALPEGWVAAMITTMTAANADVVTAKTDRSQPTIAIWQTALHEKLRHAFTVQGVRKIDAFTDTVRTVHHQFPQAQWTRFANVNTPDDADAMHALLADRTAPAALDPKANPYRYQRPAYYDEILAQEAVDAPVVAPSEIASHCDAFIAALPANQGINVIGYGSLMWNPGFAYIDAVPITLPAHQRKFAMWSISYRGHPEAPGLVLTLVEQPGTSMVGMRFRVAAHDRDAVLHYLWQREMNHMSYIPMQVRYTHAVAGEIARAPAEEDGAPPSDDVGLAFVLNPQHPQSAVHLTQEQAATIITHAQGANGSNIEYARNTADALRKAGVHCSEVETIMRLCDATQPTPLACRDRR
ncbi:MAG: gamma-glutamylcyclotransferase [Alphaproteobacteria bacterium]|nr:gamma-glutamylcyclotransferase [Alphaproteobacteria bacterium]